MNHIRIFYNKSLVTILLVASFNQLPAQKIEKIITPGLLCDHIQYLASDSMKGRNTPSPQLDSAAAYIARYFSSIGIEPVNDSYFQVFSFCRKNLGTGNTITLAKNQSEYPLQIKTDFVPFEISGSGKMETDVVFAGYGITAPEYKYDDYANIDVKGKVVLVFRNEPQKDDSGSIFNGYESTKYSSLKEKMKNAIQHGAVAMLVVNGPLNYASVKARGFPWPALSKIIPADALPQTLCTDDPVIPVVHIGESAVKILIGSVDSLRNLQTWIDSLLVPHSFKCHGITASMDIRMTEEIKETRNVVGVIPGSDMVMKNEVVVLGAG